MTYRQLYAEDDDIVEIEWKKDIIRLACCDCGLVHDLAFAPKGKKIIGMLIRGNKRATAQLRRKRFKKG